MPNQRSPDKVAVSVWIPRTLAARLKKAARAAGWSLTGYVEAIFQAATSKIELSAEEYEERETYAKLKKIGSPCKVLEDFLAARCK